MALSLLGSRADPFGSTDFFLSHGFDHLDGSGTDNLGILQNQMIFGCQTSGFVQLGTLRTVPTIVYAHIICTSRNA